MFFRLFTLGCKVNQYESEIVRTALLHHGWIEAEEGEVADFIFVNTCTVTAESESKSRKIIRKWIGGHSGAKVVVMGCAAAHHPGSFLAIDGVSEVITDKQQIPEFLRQLGIAIFPAKIESFGERHRAFIKVQDGCRVGCSYCIIPKVRPVLRSRPIHEIVPEIQALAQKGYREMVLTGIHLGHYGVDLNDPCTNLSELVRHAVDLPDEFRLRLSSLEAVEVSDTLIDLMRRYPERICPHLHLSMQSGSDAVLCRMKRRWLSEPFARRCEEILSQFDPLALTTDIIVGFPGETAAQFDETCQMVSRLRFSKVHIFRFSPRQGTAAATYPNRVPSQEQKRRAGILSDLAQKLRSGFAASLVGSRETVLLESASAGTSSRYLEMRLNQSLYAGMLVPVRITHAQDDVCWGDVLDGDGHSFARNKMHGVRQ